MSCVSTVASAVAFVGVAAACVAGDVIIRVPTLEGIDPQDAPWVELRTDPSRNAEYRQRANSSGYVFFRDVGTGTYCVGVNAAGRDRSSVKQCDESRRVEVSDRSPAAFLEFIPDGQLEVTGELHSASLNRIRRAVVTAIRRAAEARSPDDGEVVQEVYLNDEVRFRFLGLTPAVYWICASPPSATANRMHFQPECVTVDGRQIDGVGSLRSQDDPIETIIRISDQEGVRLSGKVVGGGRTSAVLLVSTFPKATLVAFARCDESGRFQIHSVPPGDFRLVASSAIEGVSGQGTILGTQARIGELPLQVGLNGIEGLEIALQEPVSFDLETVCAGPTGERQSCGFDVTASLTTAATGIVPRETYGVPEDGGRIQFPSLQPLGMRLKLDGFSEQFCLEHVEFNGKVLPTVSARVQGPGSFVATFARRNANVVGRMARQARGSLPVVVDGLVVALEKLPGRLTTSPGTARAVFAKPDEAFEFRGLCPGQYRLVGMIVPANGSSTVAAASLEVVDRMEFELSEAATAIFDPFARSLSKEHQ